MFSIRSLTAFLIAGFISPALKGDALEDLNRLFQKGNFQKILSRSENLLARDDLALEAKRKVLLLIGNSQKGLKRNDDAIRTFERLLKEFPGEGSAEVMESLAGLYQQVKEYYRETAILERLLKESPPQDKQKLLNLYNALAGAYHRLGHLGKAAQTYQAAAEALRDSPTYANSSLSSLAYMHRGVGNISMSLKTYREIVRRFPEKPDIRYAALSNIANVQQGSRMLEDARVTLEQMMRDYKNLQGAENAALKLSQLLVSTGLTEEALAVCDEAIKIYDPLRRALPLKMERAAVIARMGKHTEAVFEYRKIITDVPLTSFALAAQRQIALIYAAVGDYDRALVEAGIHYAACTSYPGYLERHLAWANRLLTMLLCQKTGTLAQSSNFLRLQQMGLNRMAQRYGLPLASPLKLQLKFSKQEQEFWNKALKRWSNASYGSTRIRGYLYLYQGKPQAAFKEFAGNYLNQTGPGLVQTSFDDLGTAVKALTGSLYDAARVQSQIRLSYRKSKTAIPSSLKTVLGDEVYQLLHQKPKFKGTINMGAYERVSDNASKYFNSKSRSSIPGSNSQVLYNSLRISSYSRKFNPAYNTLQLPSPVPLSAQKYAPLRLPGSGSSDWLSAFETSLARTYSYRAQEFLQKEYFQHARQEYQKIIDLMPNSTYSFQATRNLFKVFSSFSNSTGGIPLKESAGLWLDMMKGKPEADLGQLMLIHHEYQHGSDIGEALKDFEEYLQERPDSPWADSVQGLLGIHDLRFGNKEKAIKSLNPLLARWDELKDKERLRLCLAQAALLVYGPERALPLLTDLAPNPSSRNNNTRAGSLALQIKAAEDLSHKAQPIDFTRPTFTNEQFVYRQPLWAVERDLCDAYLKIAEKQLKEGDIQTSQLIFRFMNNYTGSYSRFKNGMSKLQAIYGEFND